MKKAKFEIEKFVPVNNALLFNQPQIKITNQPVNDFGFLHTEHSEFRANSRDIPNSLISLLFANSLSVETATTCYYIFCRKFKSSINDSLIKRLQHLVVVTSKDKNAIITCYYCKNPIKVIKKQTIKYRSNFF